MERLEMRTGFKRVFVRSRQVISTNLNQISESTLVCMYAKHSGRPVVTWCLGGLVLMVLGFGLE